MVRDARKSALLTMRVWQVRGPVTRLLASEAKPMLPLNQNQKGPEEMPAPLDPVIAQIIPLLPLRDPKTMTPQSAREARRGAAAAGRERGGFQGERRGRLSRRPRLSRFR